MNIIVQLDCLFSKLLRLFVNFLSAIVSISYRESNLLDPQYISGNNQDFKSI